MTNYKINPQGNIVKHEEIFNVYSDDLQYKGRLTPYQERGKPDEAKCYWYINECGFIEDRIWGELFSDRNRMEVGNVFLTEQKAKDHIRYLKIDFKIRQLAGDQSWIDWDDKNQDKRAICYDYEEDRVEITVTWEDSWPNTPYFQGDLLDMLMQEIGEDDLKFYCTYVREIK